MKPIIENCTPRYDDGCGQNEILFNLMLVSFYKRGHWLSHQEFEKLLAKEKTVIEKIFSNKLPELKTEDSAYDLSAKAILLLYLDTYKNYFPPK